MLGRVGVMRGTSWEAFTRPKVRAHPRLLGYEHLTGNRSGLPDSMRRNQQLSLSCFFTLVPDNYRARGIDCSPAERRPPPCSVLEPRSLIAEAESPHVHVIGRGSRALWNHSHEVLSPPHRTKPTPKPSVCDRRRFEQG